MTKRDMDDHMQRARELLEDAMGCAIEHNLSGQVSMHAALAAIAAALRSQSAQAVPEHGYAGVRVWIGAQEITLIATQPEVEMDASGEALAFLCQRALDTLDTLATAPKPEGR